MTPAAARPIFDLATETCKQDASALWQHSLCVPLLLVDPSTRQVVTNQPDPEGTLRGEQGLFLGQLPAELNIANTSINWLGQRWAMMMWPLGDDDTARRRLMLHESWHAIQDAIGLPANSPNAAHLATVEGRTGLRMEWRALARALRSTDATEVRAAIADALAFRANRRNVNEHAGDLENQLELNEGLAEYTGLRLSGAPDVVAEAADGLDRHSHDESFVRSFAYSSGPAYGLLLDRFSPGWRQHIQPGADLGAMLGNSLGLPPSSGVLPEALGLRYDRKSVWDEESAAFEAQRQLAMQWRQKLVDGPTLQLPFQNMSISFNPNGLFALPPQGTVYPTLRVVDTWGVLEVSDGALIDDAWSGVTLPGPATTSDTQLQGPGWTLKLAAGWTLTSSPEGQRLEAAH